MKRMIFKTIIFIIIGLIATLAVSIGIISTTSPSKMGNLCYGMGLKKASVYYTEKAYLKNGEFDTLALLIDRAVDTKDKKRIAQYALDFCHDKEFSAYCEKKDSVSKDGISSLDFYGYECVSCLYDNGLETPSAELAVAITSKYTASCPLATAINLAVKNENVAYGKSVFGLYEKYGNDITCDGDTLENDIARLKTMLEVTE